MFRRRASRARRRCPLASSRGVDRRPRSTPRLPSPPRTMDRVQKTGTSGSESGAPRVLVVEDEPKVARALSEGLEAEGYAVTVAHTGEDGFFLRVLRAVRPPHPRPVPSRAATASRSSAPCDRRASSPRS